MQRKPGFPAASCNIKMPDSLPVADSEPEEEGELQHKRMALFNFGHMQWGFNNWSWAVKKQDLDFVDFANGKYSAGVVAFVSITVKTLDIHRENIGYATSVATMKGSAIHQARKSAVTNALRETLLSFGGDVAPRLMDILDSSKVEKGASPAAIEPENNPNLANKQPEPKNLPVNLNKKKEPEAANMASTPATPPTNMRPGPGVLPAVKNVPPPVARPPGPPPVPLGPPPAHMGPPPTGLPPCHIPPPPRPNSNELKAAGSAPGSEGPGEEEARAERKRRQRQAQEEFRLKQLMKQKPELVEKSELGKTCTSFDNLLMDIPTQDIIIEETGVSVSAEMGKRKSPVPDGTSKRRGSVINKLAIFKD